jgi:MSHA biogenesis protein MshL
VKRQSAAFLLALLASGCAAPPPPKGLNTGISNELGRTGERKPPTRGESLERALLPPVQLGMPSVPGLELEQRFDLSVTNAPAAQVFMSIVSGTRYSMLIHPQVSGAVSVNLKDVTVEEALSALRDLYGYDYKIEGTRIFVQAAGLQSRVFQVNYLPGQRRGLTEVRVQSGAVTDAAPAAATAGGATTTSGGPASRSLESTRIRTDQQSDFWADLRTALVAIVGTAEGRSVVVSPQSGVVVVRAFPSELRAVEHYLNATRLSVERQVMLEAKIVEVTLSEAYQAGINWAAFSSGGVSAGQVNQGTLLQPGAPGRIQAIGADRVTVDASGQRTVVGSALHAFPGRDLVNHSIAGGPVFGLAVATRNFATLLTFLESQGDVQVLSSPRIATVNNQKAVLKVGTDEFFVTNVSTTSTTTGTTTQNTPSVTVQPFFSGIILDVTPQIDVNGNIILHIHPSVSEVTESTRVVNLGGQVSEIRLPLAKSSVSETDSIVRVNDGNIVAIGGLMTVDVRDERSGLPGVTDEGIGQLARNRGRTVRKKELVILLKPTVIQSDRDWEQGLRETRGRFEAMHPRGSKP